MFSFSFFPVDCTLCCCAGDGGKNCKKKSAKSHPYQMEVDAHQMEVDAYQMEVKGADNCCMRAVLTWPLAPKRHPQGAFKDTTVYDQDYSWPSTSEVVEVRTPITHPHSRPSWHSGTWWGIQAHIITTHTNCLEKPESLSYV
jgi:hypothetical protein